MNRGPREPDAFERFAAQPFFDFLDPPGWRSIAPFFYYAFGAASIGVFFAYLSRERGMILLRRPSRWLWALGVLGSLSTASMLIPRIGKFVMLCVVFGFGVPVGLIAASIYVFESDVDDTKPTESKPDEKDNAEVTETEKGGDIQEGSSGKSDGVKGRAKSE